jgi:hypothetical protein
MSRLWNRSDDNPLEGQTVLLALQSPWAETAAQLVREAGGLPLLVKNTNEAISQFLFRQPEFFVLSEGCAPTAGLLDYIQNLSSGQRREVFVVLIGQGLKSGDSLSAFSYSVNLLLNAQELPDIIVRIKKAWTSWKELYQPFIQAGLKINGC